MKVYENAINGTESLGNQSPTFVALINFYRAFNLRNPQLMEQNWLTTDEVSMSNPLGGIRRVWREISETYKRIFSGGAGVYVEFYDFSFHETDEMFLVAGREGGFFEIGESKNQLVIRTSRIYAKSNGEWRQLHHHGLFKNPALLNEYQTLINQK